MRQALRSVLVICLVEMIGVALIISPAQALLSSTGWARVVSSAAIAGYSTSHRAPVISQVAGAAAAAGAQSMAVRIVATTAFGFVGGLAGLALWHYYYNQQDLAALKQAAAPSATVPGYTGTILSSGHCSSAPGGFPCGGGALEGSAYVIIPNAPPEEQNICVTPGQLFQLGWSAKIQLYGVIGCVSYDYDSVAAPNLTGGGTATQTDIQNYLTNQSAGSPLSVESHTYPLGQGATVPAADSTVSVGVGPSEVPTTVVPSGSVTSQDAVINPNAPAPQNTTQSTTQNQESTTTTTTSTNPDGSTTTQEDTETMVACTSGAHDERTMGTILQAHMNQWAASGLVGALNQLKNLTWPSTSPTYTLPSVLFGTFTFDFHQWNGVLVALRSLIMAMASFVAYRIVFVGKA